MKHIYICLFMLLFLGCKKSNTVAPVKDMRIIINSNVPFSYYVLESETSSNNFSSKIDSNVTSVNYSFNPGIGHIITFAASTTTVSDLNASITYKGSQLGPIVAQSVGTGTVIAFTYKVPN